MSERNVMWKRELTGEALGTFHLVMMIFTLTEGCNVGRPDDESSGGACC
jgi:hypothetical protein